MSTIKDTAAAFFAACESGKGWEACAPYCHAEATFATQGDSLGGLTRLRDYAEALKGLLAGPLQGATYDTQFFGVDEERRRVGAIAIFKGTHSSEGGPVPPTGKRTESDYAYVMEFDGDRIRHLTKIWNDGFAMRQLGWGQ